MTGYSGFMSCFVRSTSCPNRDSASTATRSGATGNGLYRFGLSAQNRFIIGTARFALIRAGKLLSLPAGAKLRQPEGQRDRAQFTGENFWTRLVSPTSPV
jgi:hypothetical protein